MWNDNDDKILEILDYMYNDNTIAPFQCPICKNKDGHIFMYKEKTNSGSGWVWCSNCKKYSHFRYLIPKFWNNLETISLKELTGKPIILEENKELIDNHLNNLIKKK